MRQDKHTVSINPRYVLCGSRTASRQEDEVLRGIIVTRLEAISINITIVVGYDPKKGTPRGADKIVYQEAQRMGFTVETHAADWDRYGRGAGPVRNNKMAKLGAQRCIAFYDGTSKGTRDMMDRAALMNIPVEVVPWTRRRKGKRRKPGSTPLRLEG